MFVENIFRDCLSGRKLSCFDNQHRTPAYQFMIRNIKFFRRQRSLTPYARFIFIDLWESEKVKVVVCFKRSDFSPFCLLACVLAFYEELKQKSLFWGFSCYSLCGFLRRFNRSRKSSRNVFRGIILTEQSLLRKGF